MVKIGSLALGKVFRRSDRVVGFSAVVDNRGYWVLEIDEGSAIDEVGGDVGRLDGRYGHLRAVQNDATHLSNSRRQMGILLGNSMRGK